MKNKSDIPIKQLQQSDPPPEMKKSDEFWNEFRKRAARENQPRDENVDEKILVFDPVQFRAAIAAIAVILLCIVALHIPRNETTEPRANEIQLSQVQDLEVFVECTSVMVMQDEDHGGTFVWVTDPEEQEEG